MPEPVRLHLHTRLAEGLRTLLSDLEQRLELRAPLRMYLAGGMAVHLYTANRVTTDVDAEFAARILIPNDLVVEIRLEDGSPQLLYFDTNYNPSFALMHEDYQDNALPVDFGLPHIQMLLLAPIDLAISKIARLAANDREDLQALARAGLITAEAVAQRAEEALGAYVGNLDRLRGSIQAAVALVREAQST